MMNTAAGHQKRVIVFMAFICIFIYICSLPLQARTLKVGVWNAPPYVNVDQKGYVSGMSVQIWKTIATNAGIDYEIVVCNDITEIIDALAAGTLDASIGPHATTSDRAEKVLFSQPYYSPGVGIMVPSRSPTMWDRIRPFLTTALLGAVFSLLLMLLIIGHFIWVFERGNNPDGFPKHWYSGIGSGMWLALSALTSVGFGDIVPKTRGGRIVCGIWMLLSMVIATSFTAGLASMLTTALTADYVKTQGISSPEQIYGKVVGVIKGTNVDQVIHRYGGRVVYAEKLPGMIDELIEGKYDALGSDRVSMIYYLQCYPNNKVKVASMTLAPDNLAFAFSFKDQKLFNRFNIFLLRLQETGTIDAIIDSWINSIQLKEEESREKQSRAVKSPGNPSR